VRGEHGARLASGVARPLALQRTHSGRDDRLERVSAIVDDRYVITLHGHAFFWFVLVAATDAPVAPEPATPQPPEFITVVLPRGRASLLHEPARSTLERDVFPTALAVRQLLAHGLQPAPIALKDIVPLGSDNESPTLAILGVATNDEALILPLELAQATDKSGRCRRCAPHSRKRVPDRTKACCSTPVSTTGCGAISSMPSATARSSR